MRRGLRLGTVMMAFAVVSACGSGGTTFDSAKSIVNTVQAKALHCVSQSDASGELFTKDGWECDTTSGGGGVVTAYVFSDDGNRDNWLKVARGFGGNYVVGNRWVVATDTPALAQQVQHVLGGTIK
ncbi:MAG TPA: hypothetical protein VFJ17_05850 [Mycobacteriales bacterium]|jgi:hypothetical protein|nr:hypothetical protein [Mycobacteriales bacterium]